MAERAYPEYLGVPLDPKVFTHPVTAEPMPILVKDISVASGTPMVYTPTLSRPTSATTIVAGAFEVSVANVGAANGTLLGAVLKPGEAVDFRAPTQNDTLSAIALDATGTEFLVAKLTAV